MPNDELRINVKLSGNNKNKTIIVATSNKHKLREIRHILKGTRILGLGTRVREDGRTFEENAIKKAKAVAKKTGKIAIADDSGLMVNCLGGKPGVKSARYASPPTPQNLCRKLLRATAGCKARGARFVCAIAITNPSGKVKVVKGIIRGRIIREMRGTHGFGYDPVFVPSGYKKTFAEMKPSMKNRISHRARALRKLKSVLAGFSISGAPALADSFNLLKRQQPA